MSVKRVFVFVLAAVLVLSMLSWQTGTAHAARTWTVIAGGITSQGAVVANGFFPRRIEIGVGDTIRWQFQEFHNVVFLSGAPFPQIEVEQGGKTVFNPQVFFPVGGKTYDGTGFHNSGVPLEPGKPFSYALTFTKAGTYQYVCTIHGPGMGGTVVVKAPFSGPSPSAVLAQGRQEQARVLAAGSKVWNSKGAVRQGNTVVIPIVGSIGGRYSIWGYTRRPLTITRGTTVTWEMRDPFEIHTVSFQQGGKFPKPGSEVMVQPQKQGPPKLSWNPLVLQVTQTKSYDGTAYANSGLLFTKGFGPPNAPTSYSLTFTKPGRYTYFCWVHTTTKMGAVIIVK